MLFNSFDFAVFFPVFFLLYWFVFNRSIKAQNTWIVIASYIFYGWWDWRFLSLILLSTFVDFTVGKALGTQVAKRRRKILLWTSIVLNIGLLGFFKYFNFFIDNFISAFSLFGAEFSGYSLQVILPVGISFYTFQTLSYTLDVYHKRLEPTTDFIQFSAYVSFFPQLVAGPIERATQLLPQFSKKRTFDYNRAVDGTRQILWGLVKKVVVADNCAEFANLIFNSSDDLNAITLFLGALFFTFQIYGDFSGYSDIAIGSARILGFDLMRNFAYPYFSRDIAEFWRRWHISLSTWFRDYLYIPLGGSRGSLTKRIRNTFIIFIVSGFWHGANWTFIIWGFLNALYFLPLLISKRNRNHIDIVAKDVKVPTLRELFAIASTFLLTVFAWIFFRANDVNHALSYIYGMMNLSWYETPMIDNYKALKIGFIVVVFIIIEWFGRRDQFAIERFINTWPAFTRYCFYLLMVFAIVWLEGKTQDFVYFQF